MKDGRAVSIVVPTLREVDNLDPLAHRIAGALAESGIEWELLFVDDDSNDGSTEVAAELSKRLPVRMEVRCGGPPDLSRAVLEGIARSRFDRIVVMDADLSHAPEDIPALLARLDGDGDMVVGSRYVPGAFTAEQWGLARVLNSRVATLLAAPLASPACCGRGRDRRTGAGDARTGRTAHRSPRGTLLLHVRHARGCPYVDRRRNRPEACRCLHGRPCVKLPSRPTTPPSQIWPSFAPRSPRSRPDWSGGWSPSPASSLRPSASSDRRFRWPRS